MSVRVGRKIYYQKSLHKSSGDRHHPKFVELRTDIYISNDFNYNMKKYILGGDGNGHCSCNA